MCIITIIIHPNYNIYLQHIGDILQVIVLYVDDILITGSCTKEIGSTKSSLHSEFSMTDLGLLKQFLGLEIEQFERGIKVIQKKYVTGMLLKFKMVECKETKCPFLLGVKLGDFGSSPLENISLYQKLVGILLYITHSRPDFSYEVDVVSRYM